MSRYADLDALEKELNERLAFLRERNGSYDQYTDGFDEAVDKVENFPAAGVVAVTRCEDCEHYARWSDGRAMNYCDRLECKMFDNDFCSYGEPKDNSNEENNKGEVK